MARATGSRWGRVRAATPSLIRFVIAAALARCDENFVDVGRLVVAIAGAPGRVEMVVAPGGIEAEGLGLGEQPNELLRGREAGGYVDALSASGDLDAELHHEFMPVSIGWTR